MNLIDGFWSSLDWDQWIYGLIAGFLGGGSGAVISGVVVSVNDPKDYNFASRGFYVLVASVFLANGLLNFFGYLHQNPLPKAKVVTKVETVEKVSEAPAKTVTTTVEKTEMVPPAKP
jgi:hypothetical protein